MHRPRQFAECFRVALSLLIAHMGSVVCVAQEPVIQRIDVVNGQPGQAATLSVHGENLKNVLSLWTPFAEFSPQPPADPPNDKLAAFEGSVPPDAATGIHIARVITQQGASEASSLMIDDLQFVAGSVMNEAPNSASTLTRASCANGHVNPLLSRYFALELTDTVPVFVEIFARRLSSQLDPVLLLTDADGNEVVFCDDAEGLEGDAEFLFAPKTPGRYLLEVRDVRYTGSGQHFFHLRIGGRPPGVVSSPRIDSSKGQISGEIEPNDSRETASFVDIHSGSVVGDFRPDGDADWFRLTGTANQSLCVTARTREFGSPADVVLQLWNAEGTMLVENDDTGAGDAQLATTLTADGDYFLAVNELTGHGGPIWKYALELDQGTGRIEVTSAADHVTVPHGGSASLTLNVKRIGHSGPLRVVTDGLPDSLTSPDVFLAPNQDTVPITITSISPADAERDFFRGSLKITAFADDAGTSVAATFAPAVADKNANAPYRSVRLSPDLFVATKPPVAISLKPNVGQITLSAGQSAEVAVNATRISDWTQPIEIAAAVANQLPPGITVSAATIEGDSATITITADANAIAGMYSLFLQGTSKKDDATITQPVPPILIHVQ